MVAVCPDLFLLWVQYTQIYFYQIEHGCSLPRLISIMGAVYPDIFYEIEHGCSLPRLISIMGAVYPDIFLSD
jgi:hypothetical protein